MLHLIERALPPALHRALLPLAHKVRHRWRKWRKTPIAGVSVILTNGSGEVLLLKHSYGPKVWGLPGGGMKLREDPSDCATREMHEELGVDVHDLTKLATLEEVLSGAPHTAHLFTARLDAIPRPDQREVIEARFFPADALPEDLGHTTQRRIAAWLNVAT
ncbi:MAG: NUDIX domain-containing protein [Pseudomonadota bacterium]